LDTNNNGSLDDGEPTDETGWSGKYRFKNLADGVYHVREVLRDGWIQTYPASLKHDVIVENGKIAKRKDFGNFKLGTISGLKFEDKNGDRRKGWREYGLKNWTIKLMKFGRNGVIATALTDADGDYRFENLPAGSYLVREVQQNGWKQTTRDPHIITIRCGDYVDDVDFGNNKRK
jgi:hypothetical protein